MKLGRNDACHCGSGQKYKKCHAAADDAAKSAEFAAQAAARAALTAEAEAAEAAEAESPTAAKKVVERKAKIAAPKAPPRHANIRKHAV